jgi:hypothetical protein
VIPPALAARMSSSRFWTDYFGETSAFEHGNPELPAAHYNLEIAVGDGPHLLLQLDSWLTWCSLELRSPGAHDGRPCLVSSWMGRDGGDEQYPPYPDVLRCIEVDLIGRASAIHADLDHPGPIAALLSKLAPACDRTDVLVWLPMLEAAWRSFGVVPPAQRYRWWDDGPRPAFDLRIANFCWLATEHGHVVSQPDEDRRSGVTLASLRVAGHARVHPMVDVEEAIEGYPELDGANFPHTELARLLAAARRTCDGAITDRSERHVELARAAALGDRDAYSVLADALDGHAHPAVLRALRRHDGWAAELAAGVEPWSLLARTV